MLRASAPQFFRSTSLLLAGSFGFERTSCVDKFIKLHEACSNDKKIRMLFNEYVCRTHRNKFGKEPSSVKDAWIRIEAKYNRDLDPDRLTPDQREEGEKLYCKLQESWEGVAYACGFLALENAPTEPRGVISNVSEEIWSKKGNIAVPLTLAQERVTTDLSSISNMVNLVPREGRPIEGSKEQAYALLNTEMDAAAAIMLISPLIKDNCLLHEVGCWNGTNSIHSLVYSKSRSNGWPKYYLGTDINRIALGYAKMTFDYFDFPVNSLFEFANGTKHLGLPSRFPDAERIVRLALRVIPVLDRSSAKAFFSVAGDELGASIKKGSYLVVSYALPRGDYNTKLIQNVGRVQFENGTTALRWYEPFGVEGSGTLFQAESKEDINRRVVNTFYTDKDFRDLFDKSIFEVLETIPASESSGEDRNVSLLIRR
jgi:hypothetical protein